MKPSTIILQFVCIALGTLFMVVGVVATGKDAFGGFLAGMFLFCGAAFLGTDHTTNPRSRHIFQRLLVMLASPFLILGALLVLKFALAQRWMAALTLLGQLLVFLVNILACAYPNHPTVQRILKRLGLTKQQQ